MTKDANEVGEPGGVGMEVEKGSPADVSRMALYRYHCGHI
jgi:hypothetical protein